MQDSWGQNFRTKDAWQIAVTGCSRRSETWAQWTDVRAAIDREVPTRMRRMTRWTIWFSVKEDQPWTHSTVREISWKTGIPKSSVVCIIQKDLQLKCFKEATCTRADWGALHYKYKYKQCKISWQSVKPFPRYGDFKNIFFILFLMSTFNNPRMVVFITVQHFFGINAVVLMIYKCWNVYRLLYKIVQGH